MSVLEINTQPPAPYKKRLRVSMTKPLILTAVFASMAMGFKGLMHDYPLVQQLLPEIVGVLFITALMLQYRWASTEETFFMTHLKMGPDSVEIEYFYKEEARTVTGKPDDFIFEKQATLSRTGSSYQQSYLNIYKDKKFILRQYTSEVWTDHKFMEVVHAANN